MHFKMFFVCFECFYGGNMEFGGGGGVKSPQVIAGINTAYLRTRHSEGIEFQLI